MANFGSIVKGTCKTREILFKIHISDFRIIDPKMGRMDHEEQGRDQAYKGKRFFVCR